MEYIATARITKTDEVVDVISVYGGAWLVQDQWNTRVQYQVTAQDLSELWINAEIIETFDEIVKAFEVTDAYFMVAAISKNAEWAQAVARQWAEAY